MNMCKCWPCGSRRCSSNTDTSHAGYDPYEGMECLTRGCKARFTKWAHFSDEEMATYTRNYEKARDKSGNGSYE